MSVVFVLPSLASFWSWQPPVLFKVQVSVLFAKREKARWGGKGDGLIFPWSWKRPLPFHDGAGKPGDGGLHKERAQPESGGGR
jgi:hypothetical protein